jgi:hypothetical protein
VRLFLLVTIFLVIGCQSAPERDVLIVKDRVEKLRALSSWKPVKCEMRAKIAGPEEVKYRTAFPDESSLLDDWQVIYDWRVRRTQCEVHVQPLTPATANQKTVVEGALCTLLQVFWVHSPFDGLKVTPTDIVDQDDTVFIRQKEESDLGIYLDKKNVNLMTRTAHRGILTAAYEQHGGEWYPKELGQETTSFKVVIKDFEWDFEKPRSSPKAFWIYVGDKTSLAAHSHLELVTCK